MQIICSNVKLKLCQRPYIYKNCQTNLKEPEKGLKQETVSRDNHSQNIWDKLYFSFEIMHYRNAMHYLKDFQEIFASTDKIFISGERLRTKQ